MQERDGLITTAELAGILDQPDLRLFDCTTYLEYQPEGSTRSLYRRARTAHLRGRAYSRRGFSRSAGRILRPKHRAALHDAWRRRSSRPRSAATASAPTAAWCSIRIGTPMWATRFWWMLQSLGFETRRCSTAGFDKWKAEGRAIETGPAKGYPPATFTAKPRPGFFVDKHDVLAASTDRDTVVVNALGPQFHKGLEPSRYGRPGRIPGSVNVSAATLLDPADQGLRAARRRRSEIRRAGHHQGQARGRLLRRRHLGHHRSVPAAPARLRQPHPLRRLDGRMGQG